MNIPGPNEFTEGQGYNPFPPSWEKWLSAVRQGILSAQPEAGRHITIHEHPSKGTVIDVERTPGGGGGGGCAATIGIAVSGITIRGDCMPANWCSTGQAGVLFTDISVNGTKSLPNIDLVANCDPNPAPPGCFWITQHDDIHYEICDGPANESDLTVNYAAASLAGIWYVAILGPSISGITGILFYAETSDISSPVANQITTYSPACNDTLISSAGMDIFFGDCTAGSGDTFFTSIGKDGTVTITP